MEKDSGRQHHNNRIDINNTKLTCENLTIVSHTQTNLQKEKQRTKETK